MPKGDILVALCRHRTTSELLRLLRAEGYSALEAATMREAVAIADTRAVGGAVIGEAVAGAAHALHLARVLRRRHPLVPMVFLVAASSERLAIEALRAGFSDYLLSSQPPPSIIESLLGDLPPAEVSPRGSGPAPRTGGAGEPLIGSSAGMCSVRKYIEQVARTDSPVLITGETGTGKELVASMIHALSPRAKGPFRCLNCAAIPDSLLESELFGYDKGAFTGALNGRAGVMQAAHRGTLFLDEIGDMSLFAQAKILRSIELGNVQRLGGMRSETVDVRIIAATNYEPHAMIGENRFRKDLFFRLNVGRIHLPPLRERREDIPLLINHYTQEQCRRLGVEPKGFQDEELHVLVSHSWPGNVRELKNLVESVFISSPPRRPSLQYLPDPIRNEVRMPGAASSDPAQRLLNALTAAQWSVSQTARTLNCSRMTVYRHIRKYGIRIARLH